MAFSKSKFLTVFLLFCTLLHLGFANEQVIDDAVAQSEVVGQRLPYAQDCCNYGHSGSCVGSPNCCGNGGDYGNSSPHCVQNGCGCVENPSNNCCAGSVGHPSPPSCQWQGPSPCCGCVRTNVKVEEQNESDSVRPSSESMTPMH